MGKKKKKNSTSMYNFRDIEPIDIGFIEDENNKWVYKGIIESWELSTFNITWYGLDKYGYIFEGQSNNTWHIPDFAVASKSEYNTLLDCFFDEKIQKRIFHYELLTENCYNLYRSDFKKYPYYYKKIDEANPENPLHIDQLSDDIRNIMKIREIKIDAHNTKYFFIPETKFHQEQSNEEISKKTKNKK